MTDLGPINMKQHLKDSSKRVARLERMLGGILRPKAGIPSSGDAAPTTDQNDLSRYGSRLVVWSFSYITTASNALIATAPVGFRPAARVTLGAFTMDADGSLRVTGAAGAYAGTMTFTAAPA